MRKKIIKYTTWAIVIFLVGYNSISLKKLSEVKANDPSEAFDAATFAQQYWDNEIIPAANKAIALPELLDLLKHQPVKAFHDYSHALGIGNIRYFLTKGEGKIVSINDDDVILSIEDGNSETEISLATEFVYGNAARDAVGAIDLNEFTNTLNLNKVSAEINRIIRNIVVPPFKESVKKDNTIRFVGAIELNQKYLDLQYIELIPVSLEIISN